MSPDRPLSALEMTVLGVILKRGPCVAYAIVCEFAASATLAYRSGAGAIYPLLKRLVDRGMLQLSAKKYTLTEAGTEALRNWVRPPFDAASFSTNLDLLRARAYFLKLLTPDEVRAFADSAVVGLATLLAECRKTLEAQRASGDRFGEFAMLGAVRETEARIAWMNELPATVGLD